MRDADLPTVSFVLPTLNNGRLLDACLTTIKDQDYPPEKIEIVISDGGSKDDTVEVARRHGARVFNNPKVLAEPGMALGLSHAIGDIHVLMAQDNGLPVKDWVRQMVKPFLEDPDVWGAFTQIVPAPGDNSFTRYYCLMHVEPFTWFVYRNAANPRNFHKAYPIEKQGDGYVVYGFTPMTHPLVAFAQAFAVRKGWRRRPEYEDDDLLPFIQMLEEGHKIAYVPNAGVYHHHLNSFGHFLKKYQWRVRNGVNRGNNVGYNKRRAYLTWGRKARAYLWTPYGLSVVGPAIDSARWYLQDRDPCWFWHVPASLGLSLLIVYELARKIGRTLAGIRPAPAA